MHRNRTNEQNDSGPELLTNLESTLALVLADHRLACTAHILSFLVCDTFADWTGGSVVISIKMRKCSINIFIKTSFQATLALGTYLQSIYNKDFIKN